MVKSKRQGSNKDRQWVEAKRRCRLSREDIRTARELGLNPRSLIKNIPSPTQQWKLPVKQWIHELYEEKIGKIPVKKCHGTQSFKRIKHNANITVPLHAYTDEPASMKHRDNSLQETMTDWQEYVDE